jgi:hypothetical protein
LEQAQIVALKRTAGVISLAQAVAESSDKSGPALQAEVDAIEAERTPSAPAPEAPRVELKPDDDEDGA